MTSSVVLEPPVKDEPTETEVAWALAIRRAARADPDINADMICDIEYLQHAIVAKDKVDKALKRIRRVQRFKKQYGIKLDGSYEEGMRSLKTYLGMFPGFFLSVARRDSDGVHVLTNAFAQFQASKIKSEEAYAILIRGFFYLFQACQPDVPAMRAGIVYLSDTQGMTRKNCSFAVEERVAGVYSNAYPARIKLTAFLNVPFFIRIFISMWRIFVSKKVWQSFVFAGNRDEFLHGSSSSSNANNTSNANERNNVNDVDNKGHNGKMSQQQPFTSDILPEQWGGAINEQLFLETLDRNLRKRYAFASKFKLRDGDDDETYYEE